VIVWFKYIAVLDFILTSNPFPSFFSMLRLTASQDTKDKSERGFLVGREGNPGVWATFNPGVIRGACIYFFLNIIEA